MAMLLLGLNFIGWGIIPVEFIKGVINEFNGI